MRLPYSPRVPTRRRARASRAVVLILEVGIMLGLTAGAVVSAAGARADVSLDPATATQGSAAAVTFRIGNDRPGVPTTKVEVDWPGEAVVAEVYPMSVPGWAPRIETRELDEPVQGMHGSNLTSITSSITWVRAGDAPKKVPAVEDLRVEMGPLPSTEKLVFTVVQTYADGTERRWEGPSGDGGTVLTLTPPQVTAEAPSTAEDAVTGAEQQAGTSVEQDGGAHLGLAGLLFAVLLVLAAGGWAVVRAVGSAQPGPVPGPVQGPAPGSVQPGRSGRVDEEELAEPVGTSRER